MHCQIRSVWPCAGARGASPLDGAGKCSITGLAGGPGEAEALAGRSALH